MGNKRIFYFTGSFICDVFKLFIQFISAIIVDHAYCSNALNLNQSYLANSA